MTDLAVSGVSPLLCTFPIFNILNLTVFWEIVRFAEKAEQLGKFLTFNGKSDPKKIHPLVEGEIEDLGRRTWNSGDMYRRHVKTLKWIARAYREAEERGDDPAEDLMAYEFLQENRYCFANDGKMYAKCWTPDGFYVNEDGIWQRDAVQAK